MTSMMRKFSIRISNCLMLYITQHQQRIQGPSKASMQPGAYPEDEGWGLNIPAFSPTLSIEFGAPH